MTKDIAVEGVSYYMAGVKRMKKRKWILREELEKVISLNGDRYEFE